MNNIVQEYPQSPSFKAAINLLFSCLFVYVCIFGELLESECKCRLLLSCFFVYCFSAHVLRSVASQLFYKLSISVGSCKVYRLSVKCYPFCPLPFPSLIWFKVSYPGTVIPEYGLFSECTPFALCLMEIVLTLHRQ